MYSELIFYTFLGVTDMAKRGPYGCWSESDLIKAVTAYRNGDTGLNECSRIYHVPTATIKRHVIRETLLEMK